MRCFPESVWVSGFLLLISYEAAVHSTSSIDQWLNIFQVIANVLYNTEKSTRLWGGMWLAHHRSATCWGRLCWPAGNPTDCTPSADLKAQDTELSGNVQRAGASSAFLKFNHREYLVCGFNPRWDLKLSLNEPTVDKNLSLWRRKKKILLKVKSISAANATEPEWICVKSPPAHAENTSRAGKDLNRANSFQRRKMNVWAKDSDFCRKVWVKCVLIPS